MFHCAPARLSLLWMLVAAGCSEFALSDEDDKVSEPVILEDTFTQAPLPKVDVLWVIDNTPSMADEQTALAAAIGDFSTQLDRAGVAWQVGVITTDVSTDTAGLLLGQPWVITPGLADSAGHLADAAAVGTDGLPPEAGFAAAYLALTEPLSSGDNRGFRRADAALQVVVVSDGDDHSETILGAQPAEAFRAFLSTEETRTGRPARFSAIVGDTPNGCTGPGGNALPGTRYSRAAEDTEGIVGSICDADYDGITADLAEDSVSWPDTFALSADPVPSTVRVEVDGIRQDDGWLLLTAPPAVRFEAPPEPGAEVRIRYEVDAG